MCRPWQGESDDDDDDDSAEETALEVYDTVLDKVDSPVQEYQMLRGTLLSKFLSSLSFDITFVYNTQQIPGWDWGRHLALKNIAVIISKGLHYFSITMLLAGTIPPGRFEEAEEIIATKTRSRTCVLVVF